MPGVNPYLTHCESKSKLIGELVAVGSFKLALNYLTKQIGATNYAQIKDIFIEAHMAAQNDIQIISGLKDL